MRIANITSMLTMVFMALMVSGCVSTYDMGVKKAVRPRPDYGPQAPNTRPAVPNNPRDPSPKPDVNNDCRRNPNAVGCHTSARPTQPNNGNTRPTQPNQPGYQNNSNTRPAQPNQPNQPGYPNTTPRPGQSSGKACNRDNECPNGEKCFGGTPRSMNGQVTGHCSR